MPRPKILIVDDERFFAELLTECLAELGPDLLYARDGASALRQAKEQGPDLILLDLVMPGRDGFEVAKALKQQSETREIPIIFLTGVSRAEHRVEGLELGAEDYITKPFHAPEVVARVRKALRAAARSKGFSGRLSDLSLASIVQFLELEQKNGTLEIFTKDRRGAMQFRSGRIVGAVGGRHAGEMAFYRFLGWSEGFFQFEMGNPEVPAGAAITADTQTLLLEGARRQDELKRLQAALPPPRTCLVVSPRLDALLQGRRLTPDISRLLGQFNGQRTVSEVLEESEDDLKAAEVIARLVTKGILTPRAA
ncbi:MAG: response regulator [candidate division NC10 bacterium]|nr:response regulator [candidate division NC10 bacterium]